MMSTNSNVQDSNRRNVEGTGVPPRGKQMLNKVPIVITIFFWIIKIMATTVGETSADLLNEKLNLGLTYTTFIMSAILLVTLVFQLKSNRYVPSLYWLTVVLVSVVGTFGSDNLTDNFGVPLVTTTIIFAIAMMLTFAAWYASEKTLSIHSIYTTKREIFYWLAILFTFALGTAAGDLIAEGLNLGYWKSALMFAVLIAIVAVAHFRFKMNTVLAFWIAYILTRPFGASLGDYLSQPRNAGGLGLGTIGTSAIFFIMILGLVIYLTKTKIDSPDSVEE